MTADVAVLTTLIVYKLLLVGVGIWTRERNRDATDFYLGGRRLGPLVAAVSASASSSSAWTLLGVSGLAYKSGLTALWLFPSCVGGFLINWYFIAPRVQALTTKTQALTLTDLITDGVAEPWRRIMRVGASLTVVFFFTLYVASQFDAAGSSLSETFSGGDFAISRAEAVLIGGGIILFYTLLGGFWAVSVTDTLQGLLMAASAVVLPFAALIAVGPFDLIDRLNAVAVGGFRDPFGGKAGVAAAGLVLGLLGIGLNYPGQPHVINRFMALGGGRRELMVARRIAVGWAVIVYSGMILLGLCGRILIADLADHEGIFVALARDLLHPVLAGVVIAAVLSATMSTADSQLLVAASAVTHDLRRDAALRDLRLGRTRLVVVLVGLAALTLTLEHDTDIFKRVLFAFSAMGAAFGPLLVVRLTSGPIRSPYACASLFIGLTCVIVAKVDAVREIAGTWADACERVVPLIAAGLVAYLGRVRRTPRAD